ncbi:MAG: 30S ribosomal protein S6 [Pseudomonadota bacterium]
MALYEHVFLVRQDASPQQVEALANDMKAVIENGGGKITKTEQWGLRSITYRIKKNRKAHYALMNIEAPWDAVAEMERQMKINEDILRYMTVRVEELETGPSAVLRRQERDERDAERGDRDGGGFRDRDRGERRPFRRDNDNADKAEGDAS